MRDKVVGEGGNGIAKAQNNLIQRSKELIFEPQLPDLFPDLLNGIHFGCIRRDKEETDVIRNNKSLCFMPSCTITAEQNKVILVLFGQRFEKNVGTDGIAVWQHQKAVFTGSRLNGPIGIPVFPDMMTGDRWANALLTPTVFGFIDSSKTCLILEHQPHFSTISTAIVDLFQFLYSFFNFFEVSMTSSLAFFGCRLRGITFRHPFRFST